MTLKLKVSERMSGILKLKVSEGMSGTLKAKGE